MTDGDLHVVFQVADTEYALPASDVVQMDSFQGATPVPGSAPWVAGLVQVRGRVVPVVDLRARFGLPAIAPSLDARIVVVKYRERTVGLLADRAREVTRLPADHITPPPETGVGFVKAIARDDRRLLLLIDLDTVLSEGAVHGNDSDEPR